ncbi:MAG: methyltransferase domain-containing protein [Planctomycetota bacterium]
MAPLKEILALPNANANAEQQFQAIMARFNPADIQCWSVLYQTNQARWDLGTPAPNLQRLIQQNVPKGTRLLVPGCGYGNDALALAEAGYEVFALDFAPEALTVARNRPISSGAKIHWIQGDLFQSRPEWENYFGGWVELTCFCAIPPKRRSEYKQQLKKWLAPRGMFIGLFYIDLPAGGPPFNSTPEELKTLFSEDFYLNHFQLSSDSVERRQGHEWEAILKKKMIQEILW